MHPPREIKVYHLILVLDGSYTYIVEGKKFTLEKNDALLLVPGTIKERPYIPNPVHFVAFNYASTKGYEVQSCILFRNAVNKTIQKLLDAYPYNNYIYLSQLNDICPENEKNKQVLQNILNCVLIELFDTLKKYNTKNAHVMKALNYINDNITEPLTLNSVSKKLCFTREYTARLFKREVGMTVTEYINKQKLSFARNMLSNNAISLQDISNKLGYENYNYFSRIFKENFGISPLQMRNTLQKSIAQSIEC